MISCLYYRTGILNYTGYCVEFNLGAIFIMNLEMFFAKSLTEGPFPTRALHVQRKQQQRVQSAIRDRSLFEQVAAV